MTADSVQVRPLRASDSAWVAATQVALWGSTSVARLGELVDTTDLPGHVAVRGGRDVGLALVAAREDQYEVVSLSAAAPRSGIGRTLLARCFEDAWSQACRRVWLVTTNNNIGAIAFYQHMGMDLCRLHHDGVARSRLLKPTIPARDASGLRIDHELEFELLRTAAGAPDQP